MSSSSAADQLRQFEGAEQRIYVPLVDSIADAANTDANELFRFRFTADEPGSAAPGEASIPLQPIARNLVEECWVTRHPIQQSTVGNVHLSKCEEHLFTSVSVRLSADANIREVARQIYQESLSVALAEGYPHLIRAWNYFPNINSGADDDERYKQFSVGRAEAFREHELEREAFPAATAVGLKRGDTVRIILLSGRQPAEMIENPRQTSAYQYPRRYGPVGPSFARACWFDSNHAGQLFVSGTASIIGSESKHLHDMRSQAEETVNNVEKIVTSSHLQEGPDAQTPVLRVYIRNEDDPEIVRKLVQNKFGSEIELIALRADICRTELLVEIEGVFWSAQTPTPQQ